MGLDVYLYKYGDYKSQHHAEAEFEKEENKLWEDKSLSKIDRESAIAKLAISFGMEKISCGYGLRKEIRIDSSKYPEHMFKIGYLRSSYNESGIEHVLRDMGLATLHDIFNPDGEYEFQPDWRACLERARNALNKFDEVTNTPMGQNRAMFVGANHFAPKDQLPTNANTALTIFGVEAERSKEMPSDFKCYGNAKGEFFFDPLTVKALIPGIGSFKDAGVYVITEWKDCSWYRQALEITIEMIDWVLAQETGEFILHWSS